MVGRDARRWTRRWTAAAVAIACVALSLASCRRLFQVGALAISPEAESKRPPQAWAGLARAQLPRADIVRYAQDPDLRYSQFSQEPWAADSQRLAIDPRCTANCAIGPLAVIEPVRGSATVSLARLRSEGRIVARIRTFADALNATGAYAKFGISRAGTYYIWVDGPRGPGHPADSIRAFIVPEQQLSPADTIAELVVRWRQYPVTSPPHTHRLRNVAIMRWIWSDADQTIWGYCGPDCCELIQLSTS